jgi:hypothetical protein
LWTLGRDLPLDWKYPDGLTVMLAWDVLCWTRNISKLPLDGCPTLGGASVVVPGGHSPVGLGVVVYGPLGYVFGVWMVRLSG